MSDKEMIGSMSLDELELMAKTHIRGALTLAYSEGVVVGVERLKKTLDKIRSDEIIEKKIV